MGYQTITFLKCLKESIYNLKLKINWKHALQFKNEFKKLINIETTFEINIKNQNNFESKLKI